MLSKNEMQVFIHQEDKVTKLCDDLTAVLWGIRHEQQHGRMPLFEDIAMFREIDRKLTYELGCLRRALATIEEQCD